MTIGSTTVTERTQSFGVRRLVAAFAASPTCRRSRTAFERFERAPAPADIRRRQVACAKRGQVPALQSGFTLIELILVMTLLAVILAISAPSLSRFFRSRGLESEARRFLALTRHAQSRAVSEGVPMVLWLETKQRTYGLKADKTFVEEDPLEEQFAMDETLQVEVRLSTDALTASQTSQFKNEKQTTSGLFILRFNPDGFVSPSSPEVVVFRQKDNGELWVQSRNRLNYEIPTNRPFASR